MVDDLISRLRTLAPEQLPQPADRHERVVRRAKRRRRLIWSGSTLALLAAAGGLALVANLFAGPADTLRQIPAGAVRGSASASTGANASHRRTGTGAGPTARPPAPLLPCTMTELQVSAAQQQGAAGTVFQNVLFRNVGSVPCSLSGYPGVSFTDTAGRQLGLSARELNAFGQPVRTVAIPVGAIAQATTGVPDTTAVPAASCQPATASGLRVYPPNLTQSVTIPLSAESVCTAGAYRPFVTPVVLAAS
ncbi:MAG: DUF4232 domain-containing protein [Mycobacteriales bacterium]